MADDKQPQLGAQEAQHVGLSQVPVTRAEFEELKSLVQRLTQRLDALAPEGDIPDEHLAIMSAVFAATIGKKFRILQVNRVSNESSWTQAGRMNLHAQRHVRRS